MAGLYPGVLSRAGRYKQKFAKKENRGREKEETCSEYDSLR